MEDLPRDRMGMPEVMIHPQRISVASPDFPSQFRLQTFYDFSDPSLTRFGNDFVVNVGIAHENIIAKP